MHYGAESCDKDAASNYTERRSAEQIAARRLQSGVSKTKYRPRRVERCWTFCFGPSSDLLILLASFADYAVRRYRNDPRFSLQHVANRTAVVSHHLIVEQVFQPGATAWGQSKRFRKECSLYACRISVAVS